VKPLVMGIIGAVIGSVVVIGGLFAYLTYEPSEYEKFYADYLIVSEYYDEINDMIIDLCQREPIFVHSEDISENIRQEQEYEAFVEEYQNFVPIIKESLEKAMIVQEKYSGTKYYEEFNFIQYECNSPTMTFEFR